MISVAIFTLVPVGSFRLINSDIGSYIDHDIACGIKEGGASGQKYRQSHWLRGASHSNYGVISSYIYVNRTASAN